MGSIILMPPVLAILRLAGFHGLTNVNIPSNYGTWVNTGMESEYLDEFYVIDVILNRCPSPGGDGVDDDSVPPTPEDGETKDHVVLVRLYKPEDEADKNDFKFRAMILFLPQSRVFYCAREPRNKCVGVAKSLVPLDMSWLRLEREVKRDGSVSYTFGEGGYVKQMHRQHASDLIPENCSISAWRILTRRTLEFRQNQMVNRARQCSDSDGNMLAPDFFWGGGCWLLGTCLPCCRVQPSPGTCE
jgi:hypothetical protein